MRNAKYNSVGNIFPTNAGGNILVLEYLNYLNVKVRFIDSGFECITTMTQILKGTVKDRSVPTVYGVGILGDLYPSKVNGCTLLEYNTWCAMLYRCYSPKYQASQTSYSGCSVSENFKHYPYFYEWCHNQIGFGNPQWDLDKDLLFKGNKVYSEDTCVFLPPEINQALITRPPKDKPYLIGTHMTANGRYQAQYNVGGIKTHIGIYDNIVEAFLAYKQAKEQYLQHLAYLWEAYIDPRAFEALLHYKVDIND